MLSVAAVWWSPCAAASRHRPPHLLTNLLLALRCPPPAENTACIIQCIIKILYYTYTRYTTKLPRIVLPWLPNDLRGPKNRVRRLSGSDIESVLSRRLLPLQWWLAVDPPDDWPAAGRSTSLAALFSVEHEQLSAALSDSGLFEAGSSASILAQHPMRLLTNHSDACYCRAQTPVFHVICEPGSPQPTCLGASCAIRARQSSAPALSVFEAIHWAARNSSRHFVAAPRAAQSFNHRAACRPAGASQAN